MSEIRCEIAQPLMAATSGAHPRMGGGLLASLPWSFPELLYWAPEAVHLMAREKQPPVLSVAPWGFSASGCSQQPLGLMEMEALSWFCIASVVFLFFGYIIPGIKNWPRDQRNP